MLFLFLLPKKHKIGYNFVSNFANHREKNVPEVKRITWWIFSACCNWKSVLCMTWSQQQHTMIVFYMKVLCLLIIIILNIIHLSYTGRCLHLEVFRLFSEKGIWYWRCAYEAKFASSYKFNFSIYFHFLLVWYWTVCHSTLFYHSVYVDHRAKWWMRTEQKKFTAKKLEAECI